MAKRFCQNCGSEIAENAVFCNNCGAKQASAPQQPQPAPQPQYAPQAQPQQYTPQPQQPQQYAPRPQQYAQQPQPQQQYYPQQGQQYPQYGQYGMPPAKPKSNKALIGIIAGIVAVAAIVVFVIIFTSGGSSGGKVLKDYDYDDIIGTYEGTLKVSDVSISGSLEDMGEFYGGDIDDIKATKGDKFDCTLTLSDGALDIDYDDNFKFGPSTSIYSFEFEDGVYENTNSEEYEGYEFKETYDITLHKGKDSDYRIYGVIEYSISVDMEYDGETIKGSLAIEYIIDCEFAD